MVQGAFLCTCVPKELEVSPAGQLRKSTRDVEIVPSSFDEASQTLTSPGGCIRATGQPSVISAGRTGALLTAVVGTISNYGYLVNKYLLAELRPQEANGFTLNDVSKQEPVSVATLTAYLFSTLGPAGLLRKLRGHFALVVYDPSKAWVLAARSPGARATVIQAIGPDGSLLMASEPSHLPPGSHSLQELQPGCFKLGWHSGPRRYVKPAAAAAIISGKPAGNPQGKAAAAARASGPQETGAVKKTRRGKRGGKKHAAEAEQKSQARQKKLPGRHSLDALLHTATQSGVQLSNLRHMVISEDLPTPKAPSPPSEGASWRKPELTSWSAAKPSADASPAQRPTGWSTHQEHSAFRPRSIKAGSIEAATAAPAAAAPGSPFVPDRSAAEIASPMDVDESLAPPSRSQESAAAAAAAHHDAEPAPQITSLADGQATSPLGASGSTADGHPGQPEAALLHASGDLVESCRAEALAQPVGLPAPLAAAQLDDSTVATNKAREPSKEAAPDSALPTFSSTAAPVASFAEGLPSADENLAPAGSTPAQNDNSAGAQPRDAHQRPLLHAGGSAETGLAAANVPGAATGVPAARSSSGNGLKVQLPPIRTHSPTNSSPTTLLAPLRTAKSGQSFDSPRSRPLDDLDDIENSPPPVGTSPTRREMSQLTAGLLKRMSGRSLNKSDSNISLASTSSQGSTGQSPSSRRSPLGLLRHLAHATIRRGFASHSTPNLAAMAAEAAAGDDGSSRQGMGIPEWARQPHYEPHMESVTEDAQEGLTTPMGSLQQRTVFGTPRREHFSRKALQPRSMADPTDFETTPLSPTLQAPGFDASSMGSMRSGEAGVLGTQAGGLMWQNISHGDGEDAWDSMWSATPWDAALVGMASMRMGAGQRAMAGTHPMGMGGWEQGSAYTSLQAGQHHGHHPSHRATFTGGMQTQQHHMHHPLLNSQMKRMNKSKSCNDLEHAISGVAPRGALLAFA